MPIKMQVEGGEDFPIFVCDVCQLRIVDVWSDLASSNKTDNGGPGDVWFHHAACPTDRQYHAPIASFLWMLLYRSGIGSRSSDGVNGKVELSMSQNTSLE